MSENSYSKLSLAYADPIRNRMIICLEAAWETIEEQEFQFASLPASDDKDSPWIVDFHDHEGYITKDKVISAQTAEAIARMSVAELIEAGNQREDGLSALIRSSRSSAEALH